MFVSRVQISPRDVRAQAARAYEGILRKNHRRRRTNLTFQCIKASSRVVVARIFRMLRMRTRTRTREDSPIFPGGNRQVSPGGGLTLSTAYWGIMSVTSVRLPDSFHIIRPHSPFALARCFSSDWSWLTAFVRTETQMLSQCRRSPFDSQVCEKIPPHNASGWRRT